MTRSAVVTRAGFWSRWALLVLLVAGVADAAWWMWSVGSLAFADVTGTDWLGFGLGLVTGAALAGTLWPMGTWVVRTIRGRPGGPRAGDARALWGARSVERRIAYAVCAVNGVACVMLAVCALSAALDHQVRIHAGVLAVTCAAGVWAALVFARGKAWGGASARPVSVTAR
ncbi:hypothetical protein [Demequina sp. NBRC 110057]|uniref:hypothetical protein n=1 Tax=Demequina sp. NBRC 110057 TaxID=1570346 RepID=UPI000A03C651|nr:hypothetical protein [Demequina sp. NBRC 110057]